MKFAYHINAGEKILNIEGQTYAHLIKARRLQLGDMQDFANLQDGFVYSYKLIEIDKKRAKFELVRKSKTKTKEPKVKLHLVWCKIDPAKVKETLPKLVQLGVESVFFVNCARSQGSFKLNLEKLEKIVIEASQQSGRMQKMKLATLADLGEIKKQDNFFILDFDGESNWDFVSQYKELFILIGPEGGFSEEEKRSFKHEKILSFDTSNVLRSELAAVATAAKLLL